MRKHQLSARLALVAAATLIVAPAVVARGPATDLPIANEQLGGTILSITPGIGFDSAVLRVAGPDGYALARHFDAGTPITVDLMADAEHTAGDQAGNAAANRERAPARTALPDGAYRYEVVVGTPTGESAAHSGHFVVRNGTPTGLESTRAPLDPGVDHGGRTTTTKNASTSPEPSPQNLNVDDLVQILDTADDRMTHIYLESDETSTPPSNWHIRNDFGDIRFREFPGVGSNDRLALVAGGNVGIGTNAPFQRLTVNGTVGFTEGTTPLLMNSDGCCSAANRMIWAHSPGFSTWGIFYEDGPDKMHFQQGASLRFATFDFGSRRVGIGMESPAADFDIDDPDGSGITNIRFANGSHAWTNAVTSANGFFVFNKQGTGALEFTVTQRQHPDATIIVDGHVRATSFKTSSSRTLKTAFEAVDPVEVLSQLAALPVTAWRFKTEDERVRHIGPVAEDFQSLFGLGDGKSIATVDASGVLMAAVQGLKQLVDAKNAEIAEVRKHNALLESRLAALEVRMAASTH